MKKLSISGLEKVSKYIVVLCLFMMPLIIRGYKLPLSDIVLGVIFNIFCLVAMLCQRFFKFGTFVDKIWMGTIFWMIIIETIVLIFSPYSKGTSDASFHNFIMFLDATFLIIILVKGGLDTDYFVRIYQIVVFCAMFFLLAQVILYYGIGFRLSGKIPFLEYSIENTFDRSFLVNIGFVRCSSFFLEPSHYAQFVAPYLVFALYGYKDIVKKSYVVSILISASLVLSVSSSALVLLGSIWLLYFVLEMKKTTKRNFILIIIGILLFILASIYVLSRAGTMSMVSAMLDSKNVNKTGIRLTRGFGIYFDLPFFEKIFGIGFQNVSSAGSYYGISAATSVKNGNNEYVNDVAMFLLSFGMIGIVNVILVLIKVLKKASRPVWVITIVLFEIFISEQTLGLLWLFYMCIGIAIYKENECNIMKK